MIFFVAGGTGGHLFPAIALHQELGYKSQFIVPRKFPAEDILKSYKISPNIFPIQKKEVLFFPVIIFKTIKIILKHRPKIIIAMGGGVCIPFVIIGRLFRIPILAFEQNSIPGRAIRVSQFFVNKIITSFECTKEYLILKNKVNCLGNPIRTNYPFEDSLPLEWAAIKGKTVVIIGGSQGAMAINRFIIENKQKILSADWNIIHLTGHKFFEEKKDRIIVELVNGKHYIALPFLANMGLVYEKASLIISRSGATTLAELNEYQLPAILIPYPYAMDNHQMINAIEFSKVNKSIEIIDQSQLYESDITEKMNDVLTRSSPKKLEINKAKIKYICELIKSYLK